METIKNFIEFFSSYPGWAKLLALAGLLITTGTLVLAPRNTKQKETAGEDGKIFLKIQRVLLFPSDPDAEVQVYAYVNDTQYRYPGVAGISWLKVGPSMSPGIFEVPKSDSYEVRFEAVVRDTSSNSTRLVSQQVLQFSKLPFSGRYNLHKTQNATRSASVSAAVQFVVEGE